MSTLAWQIGQHFVMFQEFEQTMVQCNIRYNGPTSIGIKLMRDVISLFILGKHFIDLY